jgi:hypothetical protein
MTTLIKHNKPNRGDEIIIPYLAIENNINFIMLNGGVGDVDLWTERNVSQQAALLSNLMMQEMIYIVYMV